LAAVLRVVENYQDLPIGDPGNTFAIARDLGSNERDEVKFKGGTTDELKASLQGHVDMKPYERERQRLSGTGLLSQLKTQMQDVTPIRKRRLSEHDGDWDYSRRYDISPFSSSVRAFQPERTVTVVCNFAVSAWAEASEIDRYGAMVWAIVDILESCGVRTRVVYREAGLGCDYNGTTDNDIRFMLKKPGEYIAPSLLATAFQANFFRRVAFGFIVLGCDYAGKTVSMGYGKPEKNNKAIQFKEGSLILSPDSIHATSDELEREIMKAVKGEVASKSA
jgi:hypothetical protein